MVMLSLLLDVKLAVTGPHPLSSDGDRLSLVQSPQGKERVSCCETWARDAAKVEVETIEKVSLCEVVSVNATPSEDSISGISLC